MFTSLGGPEIMVIFLIILLLFGADKLPELAQKVSKGMNEFRKASNNLKNEIEKHSNDIQNTYQTTFEEQWAVDMDEDGTFDEDEPENEIEQNGETKNNENYKDNLN
jgi:TatA/E family protein of Tat protein translocase